MRLVQSKSKIWLRRLFCLFCSLVLVLTAGVSSAFVAEAKSRSELESEKSKIQSRINSTQSKLNSLSKQKKDTQEYQHPAGKNKPVAGQDLQFGERQDRPAIGD